MYKILVVDDEARIRELIRKYAEFEGYEVMEACVEAGAGDFEPSDDVFEITCEPSDFSAVRSALEEAGYTFIQAEITRIPSNTVDVLPDNMKWVNWMLDNFEDNDDVQNVYHNGILPEED